MQFKDQILEAYEFLGFSPLGDQVSHINKIIDAFINGGFKTVVLQAPTGTGKSIIGAVTAEVLHRLTPQPEDGSTRQASFLLSPTNILSTQYFDTFQKDRGRNDHRFRMVKGAGNYTCGALSTPSELQTAEQCSITVFRKTGMQNIIETDCAACEFHFERENRVFARHLITNYSFYFVDRMYTQKLAPRTLCVFDEAHLINDIFSEHNTIFLSTERVDGLKKEITDHIPGSMDVFKRLTMIGNALKNGHINETNYVDHLRELGAIYKELHVSAKELAERNLKNQARYLTLSKFEKKCFGLGCKIGDFLEFGYPCSFEIKQKDIAKGQNTDELTVKPIFCGDMFACLENATYNLLMSATLSEEYARTTLTLENAVHIELPPSFPKENKKVVFYKPRTLNYESLKRPQTTQILQQNCGEIVQHHIGLGDSGIVLAPSFVLSGAIASDIRSKFGDKITVIEQQRGDKLVNTVARFKMHDRTKGPALMVTPSGFEGVDLPGDLSRFQIILKAPFGSLGEARMRFIMERYPQVYSILTLMKLVQGAGRSVRNASDYAVTYMMDTAIQRLWNSPQMSWKKEFTTSSVSNFVTGFANYDD